MASSKSEATTASRPISVHRPASNGTGPVNVPARNGTPRNHSHSFSLGALNGANRVARRKSMSNQLAGVALAMQGMDEASLEALITPESQAPISAGNFERAGSMSTIRPGSSPHGVPVGEVTADATALSTSEKPLKLKPGPKTSKVRRASEGAHLTKSEKKRSNADIRCETCGKGYKHSSCLTKHLWEHTPQWQVTSKLLISKHQQVQMLEAASVLVTMNQDAVPGTVETIKVFDDSDRSSASPMPSAFSAVPDEEISSIETTPPPLIEEEGEVDLEGDEMEYAAEGQAMDRKDHHRYSSTSSVFSQSYQSVPSMAGSMPMVGSYGSLHNFGPNGRRPSTSGTSHSILPNEEDAKLAAAVEGVSFGTPKTRPVAGEGGVPPVPPLPARYASHKSSLSGSAFAMFGAGLGLSAPVQRLSDERGGRPAQDDHAARRSVSRGRVDEEAGMFSMEE